MDKYFDDLESILKITKTNPDAIPNAVKNRMVRYLFLQYDTIDAEAEHIIKVWLDQKKEVKQ